MPSTALLARSVALFLAAGVAEIGGGYLVWRWLRDGGSAAQGILGMGLLALYALIATLQPASFGRVYAAYGGVFIALALLWAFVADRQRPDGADLAGAALCLAGAAVIMYWPRR